MIYELEKVKLYGISWLNYSVIGLVLTILLMILTVLWFKTVVVKSSSKLDEDFGCFITLVLTSLTLICAVVTFMIATSGNYHSNTVSLSKIDNKITVQGEKVVIDVLDADKDNSKYHFSRLSTGKYPQSNEKNIFKFEKDDYYEASYLVAEDGGKIKLSEEDTKFLKESGVK